MLGKPCYSQYEMYPISGYFSKLGAHITMLADSQRVETYYQALKSAIIPGKSVVVDIGTGTGLLAMMAAQIGAKRVYAIEMGKIANVAQKLVEDNGYSDIITLHRGLSNDITLPEQADIVVSETMGFTGFEENIVEIFHDAALRLAKPDAIFIPQSISLHLAPTNNRDVKEIFSSFWKTPIKGLDFSRLGHLSTNNLYSRQSFSIQELVSSPQNAITLQLGKDEQSCANSEIIFTISQATNITGVAGWFSADMGHGIVIDSQPQQDNGHWQQFFIPFSENLQVKPDDELHIELNMTVSNNLVIFSWNVKQKREKQTINEQIGSVNELLKTLEGSI